jgi:PKHD-type hydroxylase
MKGEWCFFHRRFTPEWCNAVVSVIKSRQPQEASIGVDGKTTDEAMRKSKVWFVNKGDQELDMLFDELWRMAIQANDDWFQIHITKLDYIQIAEYDAAYKGEYKQHHDIFYMNGDPNYHRKLSCVIQLTDPSTYEGGDLEFYHLAQYPAAGVLREQGTAVFFPSYTLHAATPVTKGRRYSIAAWFDGPKWR